LDLGVRRSDQGRRLNVVDQLRVDVAVGAIHRQTRTGGAAPDRLANAGMTTQTRGPLGLRVHQAAPPFAAFPAFFRTYSFSYRIPLPLYGSGLRIFRMLAAISPTWALSLPRTTIWVGVGTSNSIPSGCGTSTGWEYPTWTSRSLPFNAAR